ncbi:MAG: hypothetical protein LBN00_04305 [Oscillospiraceae bacterium]|jgi:hypothetical protein|nr:hypothetical protein [Oscillospiraceae bacterium]
MKKVSSILCLVAITFVTGVTALAASAIKGETTAEPAERQTFTLRSVDGKIAVESGGAAEIETAIDVGNLRKYDQELLENGLNVMGYENLLSLLEDFSN